ncbi:MAG: hypothetical protein Q5556_04470, partial [Haemophilus parainfluenzae]|nr:hypothetical protein [Haemophilus parainfluenzae]
GLRGILIRCVIHYLLCLAHSLFLLYCKVRSKFKDIKKTPKNITALLSFFTLVTASKIINENYYQNTSVRLVSL